MARFLIPHADALRLAVFLLALILILAWEGLSPAWAVIAGNARRRLANLALSALNASLAGMLLPGATVSVAIWCASSGIGLIHWLGWKGGWAIVCGFLLLDLALYFQHRLIHAVPALWRLHRVHHSDPAFDVTTGFRFHPAEILLSLLFKLLVIAMLGPSALTVLIFEIVLNAASLFNHANARIRPRIETLLRVLVVTPSIHRAHHSMDPAATNSNFGFCLSWWDRMFATRLDPEALDASAHPVGLPDERDATRTTTLAGMLAMPFTKAPLTRA